MINWKTRFAKKEFWLTLIPAVLLLAQAIAVPFGYTWDFAQLGVQLTAIVNALFAVLAIMGIVVDPTTSGVGDSELVLNRQ